MFLVDGAETFLRMKIGYLVILVLFITVITEGNTRDCYPMEYASDEGECCAKCMPGRRVRTDCTRRQRTSCIPCADGTIMKKFNGERHCTKCLSCTEETGLREIRNCTIRDDTDCKPLEGFFCAEGRVDRCLAAKRHSRCEPGQYIIQAGNSKTDTKCGNCREGTFSNGTDASCQPHRQCSWILLEGTISSDSECRQGLLPGEVAGIVAGIIALILTCAVVCFIIRHKYKDGTDSDCIDDTCCNIPLKKVPTRDDDLPEQTFVPTSSDSSIITTSQRTL